MKELAKRLTNSVLQAREAFLVLDPALTGIRPAPDKWSKNEILGHLIDSAVNNHRRFINAQFQEDLVFDGYVQDKWVALQAYQTADWKSLVELWGHHNLHLARIIDLIPEEVSSRLIQEHNFDQIAFRTIPKDQSTNLAYFISDYIDHLEHHIAQILF